MQYGKARLYRVLKRIIFFLLINGRCWYSLLPTIAKTIVFFLFMDFLNYVYGAWKGTMLVHDSTSLLPQQGP